MPARDHAFEFLLPIDPDRGIRVLAKKIWSIADKEPAIAAMFGVVQEKLGSGRSLIDASYYERLKDERTVLDLPTAPESFRPLFVVAYLRAKAVLAAGKSHGIVANLEKTLARITEFLDKDGIEETFASELLIETMLAARESKSFARTLKQGAAEFRALTSDLYGPNGEDRPTWLARGAGGGGSCVCCSTVNGRTNCEPCSCWIIVIIVVIIIVAK